MKKTRRGMTTLELTVSIAVAAMFAAMSVMNMEGVKRRQRESSALRDISMQALQARASARTTQYPVRLAVRASANGTGKIIRWEQLPCNANGGRWGGFKMCPAQACQSITDCSDPKCPCVAVGESIPVPYTLDVSSLHGLCWMGQGAQPRQVSGSQSCVVDGSPPQKPYKITQTGTGTLDHVFVVDGITGRSRMIDCRDKPVDPNCTK